MTHRYFLTALVVVLLIIWLYRFRCDARSLFHTYLITADLLELWTVAGGKWHLCMPQTLVEGVHLRKLMPERCFLLQGFTTDNDVALEQLFGEHNEGTRDYDACIETIATRLSTVFASLKVLAD